MSIGLNELGPIHSNEFPSKPNSGSYKRITGVNRDQINQFQDDLKRQQIQPYEQYDNTINMNQMQLQQQEG